ncbi:MAG: YqcC family protein [Reinekea sp.]
MKTSTEPFSIDTLSFLEWLQWIYIARLRALIEAGNPLPGGAQVLPYAEESLKASAISVPGLLALIGELDKAL